MPEYQTQFLELRRRIIDREFQRMNPRQRQAVYHTEGPLLILAGAGSGKTTVLVNRIGNIIKYGRAYLSEEMEVQPTEEEIQLLQDCADGKHPADEWVARLCAVDPCPAWRILGHYLYQ